MPQPLTLAPSYDVVVLGAGPAGLAASIAIRLQTEASVLVVDGSSLEQERLGENCPPGTTLLLHRLGVVGEFRRGGHESCPGYASVWGSPRVGYNDCIVSPLGPSFRLCRGEFDEMLCRRAERLGVRLAWGTHFSRVARGGSPEKGYALRLREGRAQTESEVRAGFVVDATGPAAHFARALGVRRIVDDCLYAVFRMARVHEPQGSQQILLEAAPTGWWYHSPLPRRRAVDMVVVEKESLGALLADGFRGFEDALAATTHVGRASETLSSSEPRYLTRAIRPGILGELEGDGWMAIGDAASTFDPIVAQGIYKGLHHGLLAGARVAAWKRGAPLTPDFSTHVREQHQLYRRTRQHLYGLERRWAEAPFWRRRQRLEAGSTMTRARMTRPVQSAPPGGVKSTCVLSPLPLNVADSRITPGAPQLAAPVTAAKSEASPAAAKNQRSPKPMGS